MFAPSASLRRASATLAASPFFISPAAAFLAACAASSASWLSISHSCKASLWRWRSLRSSASMGASASSNAGLLPVPDSPIAIPHRLGNTFHGEGYSGCTAARVPIKPDKPTTAAAATKSTGCCMWSAISAAQSRSSYGNSSKLNASTGGRSSGKATGASHASPSSASASACAGSGSISFAASMHAFTASSPCNWCRSLKSFAPSGLSAPKSGTAR